MLGKASKQQGFGAARFPSSKVSEQQSFRATKLQGKKASDRHRVKTTMGTVPEGCCGVMRLATMRSFDCVPELVRQGFQALIKVKAGEQGWCSSRCR